jgi:hypothetical protein
MEICHDKRILFHLEESCLGYCYDTIRGVCSDFQVDL